jgi:acyl-CoA synthetase (AMP-forming)/AMP-acid ligase II
MNLSMLLDMAAEGFGNRIVVGHGATRYTAGELRSLSCGGAALIRETNADALVYLDVNGPAFPAALFAAARAGVPFVPLSYRLGHEQLAALLAKHPGALAIADARSNLFFDVASMPVFTNADWLAAAAASCTGDPASVESGDPAVIIYTSGTTSEPKGVVLRHHNLVSYVLGSVEFGGASRDETSLVSVPPYHIAAVANAITNLYAGRRCVALEQFTGEKWLELVRAEQVTHAFVVPTMLGWILAATGDKSVPSLRSLAYGGASMPRKVIEQALRTWPHVNFVNAYGLTETSSTISVLDADEHRAAIGSDDPAVRARLSSAGVPMPGVEIQIRAADGSVAPVGEVGRIWVRGEQVSGEYAGVDSADDSDGFFDTRDRGYLDRAGYLFVIGRADDTIIRGGENVAPAEVENVIVSHDDIDDAVVVGVPDPIWGQHLEAAVVARAGCAVDPEALRAYVRERLRVSKTPDRIVVWDELPRTETGKIVRREVLARLQREGHKLPA